MPGRRPSGSRVLLLTGAPGVGKTTVVKRVARRLEGLRIRGFWTSEIRKEGERVGFAIETVDGRKAVLAHARIRSPHRVSRYGVDLSALEKIADTALALDPPAQVYLIDEIGRMEVLSERFVAGVERILQSGRLLVATVAVRGGGLIARVKARDDAELWSVTRSNRDRLPGEIELWLDLTAPRPGA